MQHRGTIQWCRRQIPDDHDEFQPSIEEEQEEEKKNEQKKHVNNGN